MGIVVRKSIISTIITYIGVGIGVVNSLFLFPYYLEPEFIGLVNVFQSIPSLLAVIFAIGAPILTERYFFRFNDFNQKHKGFLFLVLTYPLIGYALFVLLYWIFQNQLTAIFDVKSKLFAQYMIYLVPLTLIIMYSTILESYLKVNLKISFITFSREILLRILFTFLIVFMVAFAGMNYQWGVWYIVGTYLCVLLVMIGYVWKERLLFIKPDSTHFTKPLMKEMFVYVGFMIPGALGSLVAHKIDSTMVVAMLGLAPLAIYTLANNISVMVEIPKRSLVQVTVPILSKALMEHDYRKVGELYRKNSVNQLMAGVLIFSMIWVNVDEILNLIPKAHIYREAKYVILFLGLAKLVDSLTSINSEIIQLSNHYRFNIVAVIFLAVLTVVTNLILMPLYGITGTALAYLITVFLFNVLKTSFLQIRMKLHPFTKELIPLLAFLALVLVYQHFFSVGIRPIVESLVLICIKSLVILGICLFMIRRFHISPEFNDLLTMIVKRSGILTFIERWNKN